MKILIVDDEPNTRKGLRDIVNWQAVGIDEVVTASDGLEALEAVKTFTPDVLLCDVRMPRMNGVDLVGRLRDDGRFQRMQVIFLSGFSDKEYLKAAIRYQALDYVEKPVDITQVEESVARAVERIRSIEGRNHDHLLERLADGDAGAVPVLRSLWESGCCYRVAHVGFLPRRTVPAADYPEKRLAALRNRFPHVLLHQRRPWIWTVLLAGDRSRLDNGRIREAFRELMQAGDRNLLPAMAVAPLIDKASEVPRHIGECWLMSARFFYNGYGQLYLEPGLPSGDAGRLNGLYARLVDKLKERQYDDLPELLEGMKTELRAAGIAPAKARMFALQVLLSIRQNLYAWQSDAFPIIPEERLQETLDELLTLDEVFGFVADSVRDMQEAVRRQMNREDLVPRIRRYLDEHYAEAVTLEGLSEVFRYSPNYLSTVFKKKTEVGISHYLMEVRIKQARIMLKSSDLLPSEVARQVGFRDYAHFSRVFKQMEGVSPRKWKQWNRP